MSVPTFLTIAEAAKILKVSPRTIERAIARGELPVLKVGSLTRIVDTALLELGKDRLKR